jgi:hypothetical protein
MNVTGAVNTTSLFRSSEQLNKDQLKLLNELKDKRPDLVEMAETQFKMQNLQEAVTLATNIMKQLHDMRMSIINSMR